MFALMSQFRFLNGTQKTNKKTIKISAGTDETTLESE
jgi:hypothetical protein